MLGAGCAGGGRSRQIGRNSASASSLSKRATFGEGGVGVGLSSQTPSFAPRDGAMDQVAAGVQAGLELSGGGWVLGVVWSRRDLLQDAVE